MAYNGMSDVEDRANLIAYLATFQNQRNDDAGGDARIFLASAWWYARPG
jgi:hypothetical protein